MNYLDVNGMAKLNGSFHVATWESHVLIKVEGYATLNNSLFFKDFAEEMLVQSYRDFIIDLSSCQGMDSTFLGVLVGLLNGSLTTWESEAPLGEISRVTLVNIHDFHQETLDSLGISKILCIKKTPIALPQIYMKTLKEDRYSPEKRIRMIKESHQALVALDHRNKDRFEAFLQLLESEAAAKNRS